MTRSRALVQQIKTLACELFEAVGLFDEYREYPDYRQLVSDARSKTYFDHWLSCLADGNYDIKLADQSLLQFNTWESNGVENCGFVYLECPLLCQTYDDFIDTEFPHEDTRHVSFQFEYENYLLTCDKKEIITPIRYDYSPSDYRPGAHPAAHVHVGAEEGVRLALHKLLGPMSFCLFVCRQRYVRMWEDVVLSHERLATWSKHIDELLETLPTEFRSHFDSNELMLHKCQCQR